MQSSAAESDGANEMEQHIVDTQQSAENKGADEMEERNVGANDIDG